MFSSENVITSDAEWIYEIPLLLAKEGVHKGILKKLTLPQKTPKLQDWQKIVIHLRKFKAKIFLFCKSKISPNREIGMPFARSP